MPSAGPIFDAYVMVDWSAASRPAVGADSIWWTCLERGPAGLVERATANPPTRARAEAELADLLSDLAARGLAVLAGFDFNFGFPEGFAEKLGVRDWRGVWRRLSAEIHDGDDNANDRFAAAGRLNRALSGGAEPFWGHPQGCAYEGLSPTRRGGAGLPDRRRAELRAPGTQPVWKLCYAGAVGGQTLTGIPRLERLRRHPWLAEFIRVWPFETGLAPLARAAGPSVVLAEIYPSLLPVAADGVKDRAQVLASAHHFARLDGEGGLAPLFAGDPALSPAERAAIEREEGWILGVGGAAPEAAPAVVVFDPADLPRARRLARGLPGAVLHGPGLADPAAQLRRLFAAGGAVIGLCEPAVLIRAVAPLIVPGRPEPPLLAAPGTGALVPLLGDAAALARRLSAPLFVGVGCERGCSPEDLAALAEEHLPAGIVACVASIDLKHDEPAVHALAARLGAPLRFFTAAELAAEAPRLLNPSAAVLKAVGCPGVAEGAALAAAGPRAELVVPKARSPRATLAAARIVADP